MTTIGTTTFNLFNSSIDGDVFRPGDPGWDTARTAWQLTVDQQPIAVVVPASDYDVVRTVQAARAAGVRLAPQTTGHNAAPLGSLDNTVLLRTSALNGVQIDARNHVARVEGGAVWGTVVDQAAKDGLAALAGSARDVGVVGYTLGGGLSWFGRSHGLAANHVVAAEVVTADGVLRRVDETNDADLFWAIRGGGGSFGIVTALEFRLFPIISVQAGALFWPIERASEVLRAWKDWLPGTPDAITSIGRLLRFPPLPEIPEPMRGRSFVTVELAGQLDGEQMNAYLEPLRDLGPVMDTVHEMPVVGLGQLHMDPPGPVPVTGDGFLVTDLSDEALDAYLSAVGPDTGCTLLTTELRHLGGALQPGVFTAGAVSGIAAGFAVYSGTFTPDPDSRDAARSALDLLETAMVPWTAETTYSNFAETSVGADAIFGRNVHQVLRTVKANYDPTDLFHANHPVAPETAV